MFRIFLLVACFYAAAALPYFDPENGTLSTFDLLFGAPEIDDKASSDVAEDKAGSSNARGIAEQRLSLLTPTVIQQLIDESSFAIIHTAFTDEDVSNEPADAVVDVTSESRENMITRGLRRATFSPDAKTVAVPLPTGDVGLYSAASGRKLATFRNNGTSLTTALSFSPDGSKLAYANFGQVYVVKTGVAPFQSRQEAVGHYMASRPNLASLLTALGGEAETGFTGEDVGEVIAKWRPTEVDYDAPITSISYYNSIESDSVAVAGPGPQLSVHVAESGEMIYDMRFKITPTCVVVSPDDSHMLTMTPRKPRAYLAELHGNLEGQILETLPNHRGTAESCSITNKSPFARRWRACAVSREKGSVSVWDIFEDGTYGDAVAKENRDHPFWANKTLELHLSDVETFVSQGKTFSTKSADPPADGSADSDPAPEATACAISQDGRLVALGGSDGLLRLYKSTWGEPGDGEMVAVYDRMEAMFGSAFSAREMAPKQRMMLEKQRRKMKRAPSSVAGVQFSADKERMLVSYSDGSVHVVALRAFTARFRFASLLRVLTLTQVKDSHTDSGHDSHGHLSAAPFSPLHIAAWEGAFSCSSILIDGGHGALDVDCGGLGLTPLHLAAYAGRDVIVKMMLKRGATADTRDSFNRTPLHWAAVGNKPIVVSALLAAGCPVDSVDVLGDTALTLAARMNHPEVTRVLVDAGADVLAPGKDGMSPLSFADSDIMMEALNLK